MEGLGCRFQVPLTLSPVAADPMQTYLGPPQRWAILPVAAGKSRESGCYGYRGGLVFKAHRLLYHSA